MTLLPARPSRSMNKRAARYHVMLLKEEEVNLETAFMRLTKGMVQ